MNEKLLEKFTRYEIARILGARSLQLAMDAPILLKLSKEEEDELNYNTLLIAERELEEGVLPITVKRPLPKKSEKTIKKLSEEEVKEKLEKVLQEEKREDVTEDHKAEAGVGKEEKDVEDEGEIMEMATPDDESYDESSDEGDDELS